MDSNQIVINATKRTVTGRKVNRIRRQGKLPGVMYGASFESTPIFMDLHTVSLLLRGVSGSTIVKIDLDGKEYSALVQDRQKDFIQGTLTHIDFRVVDMNVAITAPVQLNFVGEAPILAQMGGVLLTEIQEIEVEALPSDLPETLDVDLSALTSFDATITVADIVVSDKVTVLVEPDQVVATAAPPAKEEVLEEEGLEAMGEEASPEVIEKGKKDEEEEA